MVVRSEPHAAATPFGIETGGGKPPAAVVVPTAAAWLGAAGLIPFVVLACAGVLLADRLHMQLLPALAGYGAVILSFLGGVHWGMAIADSESVALGRRLVAAVIPSLIGWSALLMPIGIGLLVLAAAFVLLLMFDLRTLRRGEAPAWYPRLRWPLTIVVVASLMFGALGGAVI